jgi:hypothetical protein
VKSEEHTFIMMYLDVIKYLYAEHFESLFSSDIKEIFELSQDKSIFTYPIEIDGGYFIEGSLSARNIISKLKRISEVLEDSFELRICFEENDEQVIKEPVALD